MSSPRIIIATPLDGTPQTGFVSAAYHSAVVRLHQAGAISVPFTLMFSDDIVRARSRAVWYALQREDWDYMLWIDSDTAFDDAIVPRMVKIAEARKIGFIAAPYPRKRIPAKFPYRPLASDMVTGRLPVVDQCIEIEMIGAGFMLHSREMLSKMTEVYAHDSFLDRHDESAPHDTVALFGMLKTDAGELLSEDYSFCRRWRLIGGKIYMYVGEGSPLGHVGSHVFTGTQAELGSF